MAIIFLQKHTSLITKWCMLQGLPSLLDYHLEIYNTHFTNIFCLLVLISAYLIGHIVSVEYEEYNKRQKYMLRELSESIALSRL